jgi:hypothetical protein
MEKMNNLIINDSQNRNSKAWIKLCEYVDRLAEEGGDEFSPSEELGIELIEEIFTLPRTIGKLTQVKKIWLYGSKLKMIPPEIGKMESLEYFDIYTSYDLHWLPYELTYCKNLIDSRISTRALYGNYKNRKDFPELVNNPIRYYSEMIDCSICKKQMNYEETIQYWITLKIGTDIVPMLVNVCSEDCRKNLPTPPDNYVKFPHKGGNDIIQPADQNEQLRNRRTQKPDKNSEQTKTIENVEKFIKAEALRNLNPIKLIRKIWDK